MAGNVITEGSFWVRWLAVPSAAAGNGVTAALRVRAAVKTMASGDLDGPRPGHLPRPRHLKEIRSARASAGECARLPVASWSASRHMPEEARMPPLPHAEREPELDNLRSVTRINQHGSQPLRFGVMVAREHLGDWHECRAA